MLPLSVSVMPHALRTRPLTFGFSASRAETIARTETAIAYAKASVAAWDALGVQKVHIYDGTDWDEPCRKVHNTIQTKAWYYAHPVSHPNCRRAAGPVRED